MPSQNKFLKIPRKALGSVLGEGQKEQMKKDELHLFISWLTSVHLPNQLPTPIPPPSWTMIKIYKALPPACFSSYESNGDVLSLLVFVSLMILNT